MIADPAALVTELNRLASPVSLPKGTILFECGSPVSAVYVVRSGLIRMYLDGASEWYPPRILGAGAIAGLPATLTGSYSLSAEIVEDAELGLIPAAEVTRLFELSPQLCFVAMRIISEEIARTRSVLRNGGGEGAPEGGTLAIG